MAIPLIQEDLLAQHVIHESIVGGLGVPANELGGSAAQNLRDGLVPISASLQRGGPQRVPALGSLRSGR
eukprot:1185786-Prorocentrum_minimum.AAC.1